MTTTWSAAVLVGGRARRLDGAVKALLDVGGRSILSRQAEALAALGARPTLITPDAAPFAHCGFPVVPDALSAGALGGVYTALMAADTAYVLVLAGDLPFVTATFLEALLARRGGADTDAIVPHRHGRWHPLCAVYDRRIVPRVRARVEAGRWRVIDLVAELRVDVVDDVVLDRLDPEGRLLINVNTRGDYEHAAGLATLEG